MPPTPAPGPTPGQQRRRATERGGTCPKVALDPARRPPRPAQARGLRCAPRPWPRSHPRRTWRSRGAHPGLTGAGGSGPGCVPGRRTCRRPCCCTARRSGPARVRRALWGTCSTVSPPCRVLRWSARPGKAAQVPVLGCRQGILTPVLPRQGAQVSGPERGAQLPAWALYNPVRHYAPRDCI
jgi:hypothetical protein